MAYKSIFNTKSSTDNKFSFCQQIIKFLDDIYYKDLKHGEEMLDKLLIMIPGNRGFYTVRDLLHANDYYSIYNMSTSALAEKFMTEESLLANIDIIVNCIFEVNGNKGLRKEISIFPGTVETCTIILGMCKDMIEQFGYQFIEDDKLYIVKKDIPFNIGELNDDEVKDDVLQFFEFSSSNDLKLKKEKLTNIMFKLEPLRPQINKIFGTGIEKSLFSFANNYNIRHNNNDKADKKYYKPTISKLNNQETIDYYNYIYSFAVSIYNNINKLVDVNISGNFQ